MYEDPANGYRADMSVRQPRPGPPRGLHLATIAHEGVIWDAYLDFEEDDHRPATYRARVRFDPPTLADGPSSTQTTVIIIEETYEEAVKRARLFDDRQLQNLLRSTLPEPPE